MKIGKVSRVIMQNNNTERLNSARRGLKSHGSIILTNNLRDLKVLNILQKQYGNDLTIEKSKNIKVSIKQ